MKLILFDIDGTIMDSGGAGSRAIDSAFRDVFSIEYAIDGHGGTSLAGKTDRLILREIFNKHGVAFDSSKTGEFFESYIEHLRREIVKPGKHLKPGIREILEALDGRDDIGLGILTGNISSGARIKLEAFGIWDYFKAGAFGEDEEDRNMLLPHALRRFKEASGREVTFRDCVIVGDTPRDIDCARPYGAHAVAVATGPYRVEELLRAGADKAFEDFSAPEGFLNHIDSISAPALG